MSQPNRARTVFCSFLQTELGRVGWSWRGLPYASRRFAPSWVRARMPVQEVSHNHERSEEIKENRNP